MDEVICKEVIISTLKRRGNGTTHSPIRVIREVYEKDGTLIAEHDPCPEIFTQLDLLHFARWAKKMSYDPDKLDNRLVIKWLDSIKSAQPPQRAKEETTKFE